MVNLPSWQRILIVITLLAGVYFALPNAVYGRVESYNDAKTRIELGEAQSGDEALAASWPSWLPNDIVNLGLDLRGGVHLLAQVELEQVHAERYEEFWVGARDTIAANSDRYGAVLRETLNDGLLIKIENTSEIEGAIADVRAMAEDLGAFGFDISQDNDQILVKLTASGKAAIDTNTMNQSLEIVRRRIDATGTKEPTIQQIGDDRISIDVPGAASVQEVLGILGKTAKLTLHEVFEQTSDANARLSFDEILLPSREGGYYRMAKLPAITGDMIVDASQGFGTNASGQPTGEAVVNFRLNPAGAKKFGDFTADHVGDPFAIVLDGEVLSAPTIRSVIAGGQAQISGNFTVAEAVELSALLKSGALPAELTVLEQSVVGPDMGQDSVNAGKIASIVAMLAVMAYMIWIYRLYGLFANIALISNMILVVTLLSLIGSTLTLPGIAGIVLTIGMAVDANVLIFERVREEFATKPIVIRAIDEGFARALSSIIDANVTTLIAACVLYFFGAGPVRGFAITLMIGIVTSVFTAIYVTRLLVVWHFERRRPKHIGY